MHGGAAIWESGARRRRRAGKLAPHRKEIGGAVLHQLLQAILLQDREGVVRGAGEIGFPVGHYSWTIRLHA